MKFPYVIIEALDLDQCVAFYRDILGLPLRFSSPGWVEFSTGETTLAIHPAIGKTGNCSPGFSVPDLDAFHKKMVANHNVCLQEPQNVFGTMVAQYQDPSGLLFGVSQERKNTGKEEWN